MAMCSYHQGQVKKAMALFEDMLTYYHKFDPTSLKVQQKNVKCNFYYAKSLLAESGKAEGGADYLLAMRNLTYCTNEEIDPELHEVYSGNAFFEIFKIFIK